MKRTLVVGFIFIILLIAAQCAPGDNRRPYYGNEPLDYPGKHERAAIEDRFNAVQRRIDTNKTMGRLPEMEARDFQIRLDGIKRDYVRLMQGGEFMRYEDSRISHSLDQLENDLGNYR